MAADLDASELAYLLERLGQSVDQMPGKMRGRTLAIAGLCLAGAAAGAASHQWVGVGIAGVLAACSAGMGAGAIKRAAPERTRPALDAVRDAPERITSVRHHRPRYAPVAHWLEITTADSRLTVDADDWQRLYSALQRRCPAATFVDD